MTDAWLVRKARLDETEDLIAMRNLAYPTAPLTRSFWDWRYCSNRASDAAVLVVEHDSDIIGIQPLASFYVRRGSGRGHACMLTGVVTHPHFRRRGVFTRLIEQSAQEARKREDWLVYTFPNQYSFPGFIKGGWIHSGSLSLFLKPLDLNAIVEKRTVPPFLRGILVAAANLGFRVVKNTLLPPRPDVVINKLDSWDDRVTDLMARVSSDHGIMVERDRSYLTWRYVEHPEEAYTILQAEKSGTVVGYVVLKTAELLGLRSGLIVDILAVSPEIADHLIAESLAHFRDLELEVAATLLSGNMFYPASARRNGLVRCPEYLCPKEFYLVCHVLSPHAARATSLANWFLTWGDTDNV